MPFIQHGIGGTKAYVVNIAIAKGASQMPFVYSDAALNLMDRTVSRDRLTRYLIASNGDRCRALILYERNTYLSEGLYGVIQPLEIALRNAIHHVMANDMAKTDWYDHIPSLKPAEKNSIAQAKENIIKQRKAISPSRVIAELNFGFWTRLIAPRYEKALWVRHIYKAFPNMRPPDRKSAFRRLDDIRVLRNRVAHHEPIFSRHLGQDYERIIEALRWICPVTAAWTESLNSFQRRLRY
jgi:hypothetical protein